MASADIFSLSLFEAVFQYAYNIQYVEAFIFLMYVQLTETIFPPFCSYNKTDEGSQHRPCMVCGEKAGKHSYYGGQVEQCEYYGGQIGHCSQYGGQLEQCSNLYFSD